MNRFMQKSRGIACFILVTATIVVAVFWAHSTIAQPGRRSRAVVDPFDKQNVAGQTKIALAWGQHFEPPQNLSNTAIRLSDAVNRWTNIEASAGRNVTLSGSNLLNYPFVIVATDKTFELTDTERKNVRAFFDNGGFMFLDHSDPRSTNSGSSLKKLIRDAIPNARFEPLPVSDKIYHSYFDFNDGPPIGLPRQSADSAQFYLEGVRYKGRLVAVYCNRGYVTKWVEPDKNEPELRMGVNMVVFAQTQ